MDKVKDVVLIVLYNEDISSATSISSFLENCCFVYNELQLVIWDNSPKRMIENSTLINFHCECKYIHTPENLALSVIYNKVVSMNLSSNNIYIFDQDSILTEEYFMKMKEAIMSYPHINLFIPRIIHNGTVLSPARRFLHKGTYIYQQNYSGVIPSKRFIGIMSGMCIRISVFKHSHIMFDENLKLYGIDSKFSFDYSKYYTEVCVIDYTLQHSLSMFEEEDPNIKAKRHQSHISSLLYISRKISIWSYLSCRIALLKRKLWE